MLGLTRAGVILNIMRIFVKPLINRYGVIPNRFSNLDEWYSGATRASSFGHCERG